MRYDYLIIGGGIVGLSTALQLQQRYPTYRIAVLEKEPALAQHQTGHNSGVIHSGIYYPPGSFKARFCKAGAAATKEYCRRRGIPVAEIGKLIVATDALELERLQALHLRAREHAIATEWLDAHALAATEANIRGLAALRVPGTAVVDYRRVARQFAADFRALGGSLFTDTPVTGLSESDHCVRVHSRGQVFEGRFLLACAGLQADRLAAAMDLAVDFRIVPVRGEYYQLPAARRALTRHMIYPVPDPELPFLGVHITPLIDGRITVGPNAVFAWRREAYDGQPSDWRENWRDVKGSLTFPGVWRMGARYWRFALSEARNSLSKRHYLAAVRKYCPQLQVDDLRDYSAGIRAQAVARDGSLLHDFVFAESARSLHVCNAPSPAATSALPIGAYLCDKLAASGRC